MKVNKSKNFANGVVYALETEDGYPIELTDTFLPFYTKDAIGRKQNKLKNCDTGDRTERWMIGVSVSSGCPIRCKFCATGKLKKFRNLTSDEIVEQVMFVIKTHPDIDPGKSKEFKINYTRIGDTFLNTDNVKKAIKTINEMYPNTHHYISTIGLVDSDFSWIRDNITLQLSLHSLQEERRDDLIPFKRKMTIKQLGEVRTTSNLKTTVNLTMVDESDWNISELRKYFDPEFFFIKISPINENEISDENNLGKGIIEGINLV